MLRRWSELSAAHTSEVPSLTPNLCLFASWVRAAVSNLLFGEELMQRLVSRLEEAPELRAVAVLKRLPGGVRGFVEDELPEYCEMSWTAGSARPGHPPPMGHPCVIYWRSEAAADEAVVASEGLQERIFASAFEQTWNVAVLREGLRP